MFEYTFGYKLLQRTEWKSKYFIQRNIYGKIQNLLHKKLRTKNDFYNLLDGTQISSFYAKPKTHKTYPDIPTFRYICNFHGCLIPTSKYRSERRN